MYSVKNLFTLGLGAWKIINGGNYFYYSYYSLYWPGHPAELCVGVQGSHLRRTQTHW